MSFWSGETLKDRLRDLIEDFHEENIDCNAYTLTMGDECYVTPDPTQPEQSHNVKRQLKPGESFVIPSGQFAFLLTKERVRVPNNAMAFISMKAGIKLYGIVNVSGFHVDPGYYGKLIFSVFNSGPSPCHFSQGQPIFLIWYADIDRESDSGFVKSGHNSNTITRERLDSETVNRIRGSVNSIEGLRYKIDELDKRLRRVEIIRSSLQSISAALIFIFFSAIFTFEEFRKWVISLFY